jgi:glycosyltransferase involved in cell wall biosynthesis
MRIVHVITRLIIGGAQENTLISCQGQHARGDDVTLITGPAIGPEGSLLERATAAGIRVIVMDEMRRAIHPLRDVQVYRHLIGHLRRLQPDIVHTHSSKGGIIGRRAAHAAGLPVILHTIHGLAFTASTKPIINWTYKYLERQAAPLTTRIICVADAMRDQSLAAGIGKPEQYITIYSGMETAPFINPPVPRQIIRQSLGITDNQFIVGTIARLFDLKGHDDLLDIAPEICRQFPNLRFLWLGDGLLREKFEARMTQMNLRDRFILTGMVPPVRVPELVGAMDLLVHPSRREGLARALPQAALAQKPVITYDIDGNREGLQNNITGILIPPFDKKLLLDSISKLAHDPQRCTQMGIAGRDFALKRFDSEVMVSALDRLYRDLLHLPSS